jgi:hypothetical protein
MTVAAKECDTLCNVNAFMQIHPSSLMIEQGLWFAG